MTYIWNEDALRMYCINQPTQVYVLWLVDYDNEFGLNAFQNVKPYTV
jgi:hypothetical protein